MDDETVDAHFNFLNDWPLRRFLILGMATVVFLLLFALCREMYEGALMNEPIGLLLVPLVIFVPGAAVLRILRIHAIGFTKSAIYSLGLGIMIVMIVGGALNILHYTGPITEPLTVWPITLSFTAVMIILLWATYYRDRDFVNLLSRPKVGFETLLTWAFAIILPLVVVLGTSVADYNGDRTMIFYALIVICAAPLIILCRSTKNYEVMVFSLSLSLMLHRGLMTNYLMGYDVFSEYYSALTTATQGYWDVFYEFGANTAMSMTTLAPMLANLTSIHMVELIKMVYPFLFSFTGLAIYKIVQCQLGARPAMAASFLFIGYQAFFALMMQLAKQQMAEVFLLMFFLCVTDLALPRKHRRFFAIVALFGIVVSHYALAYIAIGLVIGLVALHTLWHFVTCTKEWVGTSGRQPVHRWFIDMVRSWYHDQRRNQIISIDIALLFLAIFYFWFSVTASGMMLQYGENVSQYVGPPTGGGLLLYQMDSIEFILIDYGDVLHNIEKYLVVLSQAICIIGVLFTLLRFKRFEEPKLSRDFVLLGALAALIIVGCYTIPRFSFSFYFARFFHVGYIFLSGFFVIGLYALVNFYRRKERNVSGIVTRLRKDRVTLTVATLFLVLFLLFNTGFTYGIGGGSSNSFALNSKASWSHYSDADVLSAKWVGSTDHHGNTPITVDWHRFPIFAGEGVTIQILEYQWTENQTDVLLYLSTWNVQQHWVLSSNYNGSSKQSYTPLSEILSQVDNRTEVVYTTGGQAMVLYVPPQQPETNPVGPPFHTYEDTPAYVLSGIAVIAGIGAVVIVLLRRWK